MHVEIDLVLAEVVEEKEVNVRKCNRILVGMELFPKPLVCAIIYSAICGDNICTKRCCCHNEFFKFYVISPMEQHRNKTSFFTSLIVLLVVKMYNFIFNFSYGFFRWLQKRWTEFILRQSGPPCVL